MSDKFFRPLVCILLSCILAVQLYNVLNKPVTYGDLLNAKQADQKKQLLMKVPLVHAQLNEPISVDLSNEPLRVTIE